MEKIYVVKVFTSNLLDAGTDANVFLEMLSTNGNTSGEKKKKSFILMSGKKHTIKTIVLFEA